MQSILHPLIGPAGPETADLTGRVAVITGGALGIGYEIARAFAQYGGRVIMLNRKQEQGDEAISKIETEAKEKLGKEAKIEWKQCDLGDLGMVKEVFGGLAKELDRLDFLICSAGINSNQFGFDADGIDRHMGVNAFGHFYAINQLYPLLRKTSKIPGTPAPRIVFESSEMHRMAPGGVHFGSMEEINDSSLGPVQLYGRTKLAMILYTKSIFEKVIKANGDNIYVLAVHPGAVNTDMQDQWEAAYPGMFGFVTKWVTLAMGRDVEQGSYSALYAALSSEVVEKNYNGYYLSDPGTPGKETSQGADKMLAQALWELSHRLVEEKLGKDALKPWDSVA